MYGITNPLLYFNGKSVSVIPSEEGVHQGDPLGPFLFALSIHPIINRLQKKHSNLTILAYLDDIFVVGYSQQYESVLTDLRKEFQTIYPKICDRKCEIYLPSAKENNVNRFSVPIVSSGVDILGVPIGNDSYVQSRCNKSAAAGEGLCSQLLYLNDPQSALLLLRYCHVPTLNHLARCVPPPVLHQAFHIHDQLSRDTFAAILGLSALDELTWKQASLKIKLGGFGITNLTQISAAAFVGSWCYSMSTIPQRFPSRIDLCDSLNCASPPPFYQHLCKTIASLPSTLGSDGETLIPQSLSGLMANPVKLQNCLSSDIAEGIAATCIMQASSVKHAARIRSCQGRGAGSWLQAIPSTPKFVLKSSEFCVAAFLDLVFLYHIPRLLPSVIVVEALMNMVIIY